MCVVTNKIPLPPRPTGTPEQQVQQLWSYIFQLVEKLNKESGQNVRKA